MSLSLADVRVVTRARRSAREVWLFPLVDLGTFVAAFFLSRIVNWAVHGHDLATTFFGWREETGDIRVITYGSLAIASVLAFMRLGHYARRRPFWQEIGDVIVVVVTMALIDAALVFLTKGNMSRIWMLTNWTSLLVLIPLARWTVKHTMMAMGAWHRPTLVLGTGPNAIDAASAIASEPLLGFDVVAFLAPGKADSPRELLVDGAPIPVLNALPHDGLLPDGLGRPHVVVALEMREMEQHRALIERLALSTRSMDLVSPVRGLPVAATQVTHFFSHDVLALRLHNNLASPVARAIKRAFDLVVASLLLVLLAPLFLWLRRQIRKDGGPAIFGHERVGRDGESFVCYKFRTMVPGAQAELEHLLASDPELAREWEQNHKLKDDPRITPIGRFLRRTSLDELPQLWNVLKGEMSLVGPRPVVTEELARYGESLPYYFESTPGITGLWQVSGRNDVDYRRRVHLDCWYVKNWSLWYDVVILLRTIPILFRRNGAY
mgnify:CR=1 FL=1